jgi:NitT/TauT family transport system substrate-binding protein
LDIVQMADFPSVLGATALKAAGDKVQSLYIATLSAGINGAGNAILVPSASKVQSLAELKGKKISVPFGSTAHAMLIRALQDLGWDPTKDVEIVTQTPEVGGSALKANQIDAHANFVPFGELFPFRGFARKIYDGSSTGFTTTHGVQVRSDYAEKYPEIVVAYLKATLEADRLYREDPEGISEKLAGWTGVDAEVYYAFHGPQGIQTRDYTLKPEHVKAIAKAQDSLKVLKKVTKEIDVGTYVNDKVHSPSRQRIRLRLRRPAQGLQRATVRRQRARYAGSGQRRDAGRADLGQGRTQGAALQLDRGDLRGARSART